MDRNRLTNRQTRNTTITPGTLPLHSTHLQIAQINAHHSRIVMDELREEVSSRKIDVIAIQEPYCYNDTIPGLGTATRIVTDNKRFSRIASVDKIHVAIAVPNRDYTVLKIEQLSNTHCVCAEVTGKQLSVFIVNAYFQWSEEIEPYIQHLDRVLQHLKGRNVVVCADVNAKSQLWHGSDTDERGEKLEHLIAQHNLYIVNKPSSTFTYSNIQGASNIDVTLANSVSYNRIQHWKIHEDSTSSDHNLITFNINTSGPDTATRITKSSRYNTKRANWDRFLEVLEERMENSNLPRSDEEIVDPDTIATELESIITSACNASIPRKMRFPKSAPWWTKELTVLKKQSRAARRVYQANQNTHRKETLQARYRTLRNKYISKIREAKNSNWREFVSKEGNSNPWGIIYKMKTDKIQTETAYETIKNGTTQTTTTEHTMAALLDTLIPDDDTTIETAWHSTAREEANAAPETEPTPRFSIQEVEIVIRKLKNGKAPGHDLIETEIIKKAWPTMKFALTKFLNVCLAAGAFPKTWKKGVIRVLLKGKDKDKTNAKSYRPTCLLPILSKVLEKLISQRLEPLLSAHLLSSNRQFGFRRGKSTEDAIVELRETVNQTPEKYVIALLFDIAGAFDNVWWPSILLNLKKRGCPKNIYSLIQSYLSERTVIISSNSNAEHGKTVNKGCPQGSILGPCFWNLIFDDLLNTLEAAGYQIIAYADDLIVLIPGNSRKSIEELANRTVECIMNWCRKQKLQLSPNKSEMILLKGFMDTKRPPTVKIGQTSMKMATTVKYLGVHLGTRLNITPHIKHITSKSKTIFNKLSHIAKAHWGITHKNMMTLYKGIFVPIITYAAAGWGDKLNAWHTKTLKQAQRYALVRATRAYRTISFDALTVIAAATPIDLLISERRAIYLLKHNMHFKLGNLTYVPQGAAPDKSRLDQLRNSIEAETQNQWQNNWQLSSKGRTTYKFFENIKDRQEADWMQLTFYNMQLLSGHGLLKNYHKFINVSPTDLCNCTLPDSIEHVIYECQILNQFRTALVQKLEATGVRWPCRLKDLVQKGAFQEFTVFATQALKHRQAIEYRTLPPDRTNTTQRPTRTTTTSTTERRITRAMARQDQGQQ